MLLRLVRVSLTGIFQFMIAQTSWIGLVRIVSTFGARGAGGIHDRDSHRDICDFAVLGAEQCRGHAGRPEPGREAAGARRDIRVAHGALQHDVSGRRRASFLVLFAAADRAHFYERSGGGAAGGLLPAHREHGEHRLCVRDGDAPGVQWRGRYGDADDREFFRILGVRDSAGLLAGDSAGMRANGVYWSIVMAEGAMAVASMLLFRQGPLEAAEDLGPKADSSASAAADGSE